MTGLCTIKLEALLSLEDIIAVMESLCAVKLYSLANEIKCK